MVADRSDDWLRRAVLVLGVLGTIAACIGVRHRAADGRNALLKWGWAFEALEEGESVYETGPPTEDRPTSEGFPAPPVTLVVLAPFDALGPAAGPLAWAAAQAALAWWIVIAAFRLAAGRASAFGAAGQLVVVIVAGRVLYSELQHGNVNLTVGATVVAAAVALGRGRAGTAGAWLGVGTALKATPALGLVWIARARSGRGTVGFAAGLAVAGIVVPALWLGPARTLELVAGWWRQMAAPYLGGRPVGLVQSEHINQSLLGALARHLTDAVAIEARPPTHPEDVRIGWLALGPTALRIVHATACLAVLAWIWRSLAPRGARPRGERALGTGALLALGMVLCSERSWKHHFVLLPLPLAYLAWRAARAGGGSRERRIAVAGIACAVLAYLGTGELCLGPAGADLAEAYGAYTGGAVALLVAVGLLLRGGNREGSTGTAEAPCLAHVDSLS